MVLRGLVGSAVVGLLWLTTALGASATPADLECKPAAEVGETLKANKARAVQGLDGEPLRRLIILANAIETAGGYPVRDWTAGLVALMPDGRLFMGFGMGEEVCASTFAPKEHVDKTLNAIFGQMT